RMGFLDYVAKRRRDVANPQLFPELPVGKTGYRSDPFSKWAGRFFKSVIPEPCRASFHSLRHHWRDALREIGASLDDVTALGGWKGRGRSEECNYGDGPSLKRLHKQISKLKYEGLDLSHLYATRMQPVAPNRRVRSRRR